MGLSFLSLQFDRISMQSNMAISPFLPQYLSTLIMNNHLFFIVQEYEVILKGLCILSEFRFEYSKMLDLVQQIESYSPQTNQPKPNAYNSDTNTGIAKAPLIDNSHEQRMDGAAEKGPAEEDTSCMRFFKQKFYEEYFKVSEEEVVTRIKSAIIPPFREDFLESIQPNPDMYGPFWIQTTLIFLLGTVGNFSNYLYSKFSDKQVWDGYFFDLSLVRYAFVMIYVYAAGVPLLLFFVLKLMGAPLPLPQVICAYGYSNTCFVLAALLCIFPLGFLQWILFLYAFANSTFFMAVCLKKHLQGSNAKLVPVLGIVAAAQFILFLTCKLFFVELK